MPAPVGTEFSRVVPDFVAQQRGIYTDHRLRDEVTRLGLTRANLSWASSGLDTGRPGYTLGHTPQPDVLDLGHLICIDTGCCKGGWLTALDVDTGEKWQVDERGLRRG